ncbi:hypothetical protein D3C83_144040 [compost metagenome]
MNAVTRPHAFTGVVGGAGFGLGLADPPSICPEEFVVAERQRFAPTWTFPLKTVPGAIENV